jgi:hypothetical protein
MKFVIALNKKSPLTAQINAAGHLCLGMPALLDGRSILLRTFLDSDGTKGSLLTDYPLIIFSARNSNHLRDAHALALNSGIAANAFFECHRDPDPDEQEALVRKMPLSEQEYVGLSLFGADDELRTVTRRFSLMREAKQEA